MIQTWTIKQHIRGNTLNAKDITFPFDISNCKIDLDFKLGSGSVIFKWSTDNNTFVKTSDFTINMKSRYLDFKQGTYSAYLKVTFPDGTVQTYFKANLQII